jgi:hypothetical protein
MPSLLDLFPNLSATGYQVTSPPDLNYNCIAWAAGETHRPWWPGGFYWPPGVPCQETLAAFIEAFRTLGYVPCDEGNVEVGFEKIALFALSGVPKHAARQLPNGRWSSKLGVAVDIEHALEGVAGALYGTATQFLKRPLGGGAAQPSSS